MKNPNGYGSVVKLTGNRRKPYCARKTSGWNEKGYPIYSVIGYYAERADAMIALAEYNKSPYDLVLSQISMRSLYEKWMLRDSSKMPHNTAVSYRTAFKYASALYELPYRSIKAYQMQAVIDGCGYGYATQGAIKSLFAGLDRFALELDIINKCNSSLLSTLPTPPTSKIPFSEEEIEAVWHISEQPWVDSVLFFLYTGFRISEVLSLETENIDLVQMTIKGGLKTKAGRDRIVPIHPRLLPLIEKRMAEGASYLFSLNGRPISATYYYRFWHAVMDSLSMRHTPHECRHTFRSRLDSAGGNKKCIDLLMGHASSDVGERIYTHKTLCELRETVALLR